MDGLDLSDDGHPFQPQLLPAAAAPGTENSGLAVRLHASGQGGLFQGSQECSGSFQFVL